ncbi:MAG: hypothetical protein AB7O32_20660, partial [Vicinamibacterales bacterium]
MFSAKWCVPALVLSLAACGGGPAGEPEKAAETAPEPAAAPPPAPTTPLLYVTNERAGSVTVVDTGTLDVVTTVPLGKRPRGMAVSPDQSKLYVALSGSPIAGPGVDEKTLPPADKAADGIGVVDVKTQTLLTILKAGSDPESVAIGSDGTQAFTANEDTGQASIIDLAS